MEEPTKRWEKNLEIYDLYFKHSCISLMQASKVLLDDPELPFEFRESLQIVYDQSRKALEDYRDYPIYPKTFRRRIRDD